MKYVDAEDLKAKLDEHYRNYQSKYMETRTPYTQGLIDALDLAEQVIDSLQQEQPEPPNIAEYYYHKGVYEGLSQGRADALKMLEEFMKRKANPVIVIKQQEHPEPSCKTCGFYENNCPFIRGTFKPYPNKVCKDYTYSVMKEHEQPEVDFKIEERKWVHDAVDNIFPEDGDFMSEVDFRKILKDTARHFYELGMSVMKERITNPDYNQKVIEKIKSEYPIDEANARKEESK